MPMWSGFPVAGPERLLAALADSTMKATVLLTAAGVLVGALRRGSAAWRHWILVLAMLGAGGLPALAAVLPGWRPSVPVSWVARSAPEAGADRPVAFAEVPFMVRVDAPREPAPAKARAGLPAKRPLRPAPVVAPGASSLRRLAEIPAAVWLVALWALGVGLTLAPVGLGLASLARLGRSARVVTDPALLGLVARLAGSLGGLRPIRLLQSAERSMPMTWGWRRPVILLPADAATWGEERLRTALLHELAHVRRGDCLTQLLLRIVSAWQWFNPLSWWTLGRVRVEQERACDDLAMGSGLDPTDYAGHLLAIASGRGGRGLGFGVPSLALAMAALSRIERRLLSILDVRRNRRALSRRRAGLSAALAAALMFPLAALQLPSATAQPPAPGTANGQSAARPEQAEVLEKLRTLYVKAPDEDELRRGAIKGMIGALYDPYSEYLTPEQAADLDRQIQGKLSGIGAQLDQKEKTIRVITPLLRSPAFQAGIKAGDVILAVDGRAVEGRSLTDVVKQIVGPAGTVVQIKVRHADGREVDLALTRGPIALETVKGFRRGENQEWDHWIDPERQIGYVRVEQFGPGTPKDLDDAVRPLIERGLKGLILDLRFGSGGLMDSAIATARRFLAKGTIVSVQGRDGAVTTYRADGKETLGDFPLVVLANGQTASSAEIVAGALKDNGRAVLVGERTFGKGSVQTIVALKDGSGALKLTTAYYTLPSGRVYDRREGKSTWGIDPTEGDYIPMAPEATETLVKRRRALDVLDGAERAKPEADPADPQLAAALKTLVARLTTGEFVKVGIPASALEARMTQRAEIEKRREALLQGLRKVDQELEALDKPGP